MIGKTEERLNNLIGDLEENYTPQRADIVYLEIIRNYSKDNDLRTLYIQELRKIDNRHSKKSPDSKSSW